MTKAEKIALIIKGHINALKILENSSVQNRFTQKSYQYHMDRLNKLWYGDNYVYSVEELEQRRDHAM